MRLVIDWAECMARLERELLLPTGSFINRVGGSDTNALAALLEVRDMGGPEDCPIMRGHLDIVKRYNGFYDLQDDYRSFIGYLENILKIYENSDHLFFCNYQLLSMYMPDTLHPSFFRSDIPGRRGFELLFGRLSKSSREVVAYPYQFVEKMVSHQYSLFNLFGTVLSGKRVLVVSPFSDSIVANFAKRKSFFKRYIYPDFDLRCVSTPITYAGLPKEFYPHSNWFETCAALIDEIRNVDYDVALLSCGSYALPIGEYIRGCGKKAIYVGGILQMYFGISGRRYDGNSFFDDQINKEAFIRPIEGARYLAHTSVSPELAKEAFGAYF